MTIIRNVHLRQFLALSRVKVLWYAFSDSHQENLSALPRFDILLAFIVACTPLIGVVMQSNGVHFDAPIVFSGLALVSALLLRNKNGVRYTPVSSWKDSFSKTHTAFGLSCIPLALILVFYRDAFYSIELGIEPNTGANHAPASFHRLATFILFTSLWAGLSEEIIYRGLLLSFLRRAPIPYPQQTKDYLAILISALLFAANHYVAWGMWLCVAVFCLGLGFGIAYVSIRERLLPVILYHAAFDVLSLSVAFLTFRL
ncbi:MAG: CPBP family intramembrane metalloprotease [Bdellovibrionales bacterium]|nr:CPBP family intramembrane metalloprotease [Bdellovibrionales bacterium]